jgi:hypothetical protein
MKSVFYEHQHSPCAHFRGGFEEEESECHCEGLGQVPNSAGEEGCVVCEGLWGMREWWFKMAIVCKHPAGKVHEAEQGYHTPRNCFGGHGAHYAEMRGSKNLLDASGSKADGRGLGCKTVPGAKAAPSAKKCIILAIGALAAISLEGSQESSPHDQAPDVQLKAGPHSQSVKPQAQSLMTTGLRPIPEVSLPIATSVGTVGASTS